MILFSLIMVVHGYFAKKGDDSAGVPRTQRNIRKMHDSKKYHLEDSTNDTAIVQSLLRPQYGTFYLTQLMRVITVGTRTEIGTNAIQR